MKFRASPLRFVGRDFVMGYGEGFWGREWIARVLYVVILVFVEVTF